MRSLGSSSFAPQIVIRKTRFRFIGLHNLCGDDDSVQSSEPILGHAHHRICMTHWRTLYISDIPPRILRNRMTNFNMRLLNMLLAYYRIAG